ncbi:MAG: RNA methyltransferase, partial [Deltaproteobacteria bacterium]|nr:RNA methyltransferase [Deltaproteobacteria bacterium]
MDFRSWLATCPRGAERALESELSALGAKGIRSRPGLVRFTGTRETALRAVLDLRCALRVLEPVGEFPCTNADELYAGMRTLPWSEWLPEGLTFAVSAGGKQKGLEHTQFVGLKTKDAIVDVLRDARGNRPDVNPHEPDVLVIVHLGDGKCSVSIDLAGGLLSDRGYRVRTTEAPLREALAAAVIRLSGWDLQRPFHDPVCGSGTLAIEAAGMAIGVAPNLNRPLACERWPRTKDADAKSLARLREELNERAKQRLDAGIPEIRATDRSKEAVAAAQANVHAAGLEGWVSVGEADARELKPMDP